MSVTRASITSDSITSGAITSGSIGGGGGLNPPANSIFFWPFLDGSLEETIEGNDATYTDSVDNIPDFDSNGWVLDKANSPVATAPVSTAQVDLQAVTGEFNGSGFIDGVNVVVSGVSVDLIFSANNGGTASKYAGNLDNINKDDIGSLLITENCKLEVSDVLDASSIRCDILLGSDAQIQEEFAYDKNFKWLRHTSSYTLAGVKTLRSNIGDGSTWIDTPLNDFFIKTEFYFDLYDTTNRSIWSRLIGTDYEIIGYVDKGGGNLAVGYVSSVSSNVETVGAIITNYDSSKPFTVRVEKNSAAPLTSISIVHNGVTYTDSIAVSQGITQSTFIDFAATTAATLSHTIAYIAAGDL